MTGLRSGGTATFQPTTATARSQHGSPDTVTPPAGARPPHASSGWGAAPLGLRWRDIDFEAGTLSVRQTRVQVSTDPRGWTLGAPKSNASRRTIRPDSVLPGTLDMLRAVRGVGSRLVVVDPLGEPPAPRWFSHRFAQVCAEAGVPVIHAHSTRHTLAYFMAEKGIPAVNAAAYLGHTTAVFMDIYLRHKVEGLAAAEDALGAVFASARGA